MADEREALREAEGTLRWAAASFDPLSWYWRRQLRKAVVGYRRARRVHIAADHFEGCDCGWYGGKPRTTLDEPGES